MTSAVEDRSYLVNHFNSHAHVERDGYSVYLIQTKGISTHTLTWSVTQKTAERNDGIDISTHTLTWSVTCGKSYTYIELCDFNSHAHVERDLLLTPTALPTSSFQLTRSRGA